MAKYSNTLCTCYWPLNFGGTGATSNNIVAGLSIDSENNPIITRQLYGTDANANPLGTTPLMLSSIGDNDCFVIKYNSDGTLWLSTPLANENFTNETITIFPNPAKNALYINSSRKINKIEIINTLGQIQNLHRENTKVDVLFLDEGIYFLKGIFEDLTRHTTKFIKN